VDSGATELIVVLVVMAAIFIFAIVAVVIFLRQWRKEHK
jgi:heme/copper-type cytochrome/quinol oxidase subunit 2